MSNREYWEGLLNDIIYKDEQQKSKESAKKELAMSSDSGFKSLNNNSNDEKKPIHRRSTRTSYIFIGHHFPNSTITAREADCLLQFAQGKTIRGTAQALDLSPRTVEFYLKNMKSKLHCYSKAEFIEKIINEIELDDIRNQLKKIEEESKLKNRSTQ